jgi:hypothetical protein
MPGAFSAMGNLLGRSNHESMTAVATFYKPSQWRGKRLVYRSTDPSEPKQETLKFAKILVGGFIWLGTLWLVSRLVK